MSMAKVGKEEGQGEKGHQRSDAATGIDYLQGSVGEGNNITFPKGRETQELEETKGNFCGHQFKRKGDSIIKDIWQRDAEQQN